MTASRGGNDGLFILRIPGACSCTGQAGASRCLKSMLPNPCAMDCLNVIVRVPGGLAQCFGRASGKIRIAFTNVNIVSDCDMHAGNLTFVVSLATSLMCMKFRRHYRLHISNCTAVISTTSS